MMRSVVVCAAALAVLAQSTAAFTSPSFPVVRQETRTRVFANTKETSLEEAAALKAQAEKIRLEAEKMDAALTLQKMDALEKKLKDKERLKRHPDEEVELLAKLDDLSNKLQGKPPAPRRTQPVVSSKEAKPQQEEETSTTAEQSSIQVGGEPVVGFEKDELAIYLPVALEIEKRLNSTATTEEKLEAFRSAPELQEHFSNKIQALLVGPMEDLQKIESLKLQYLKSTSSVEKDQLKREIHSLENSLESESPLTFASNSASIYRPVPELSEAELDELCKPIQELPDVLQALYKRRNEVDDDGDLRVAVLMDHYEPQLQRLDQIRFTAPLSEESKRQAIQAFESLPKVVQENFCKNIGLEPGADAATVIKELEGGEVETLNLGFGNVVVEASKTLDLPEYSDIEFLDRSRYLEELIPSIARMEETRPTEEEIDTFCTEVLGKDTYTLTSKPERVLGGYYLRGINRVSGDQANNVLVERLNEKLQKSSLKDDVQFFYIQDPTSLTDEEIETGDTERPILVVTSNNPQELYNLSRPLTKGLISAAGLLSAFVFALGACGMNGVTMDRLQQALDTGSTDVSWLTDMFVPTVLAVLGIQFVHEFAHRIVAWKDKFDIGLPNLIPSIQLGLTGAITPFKSPPKNWNSMFDFAISGPLAGILASILCLVTGLSITASLDMAAQAQLPVLPTYLLHASALGGGLVESFLGNGVLDTATPDVSILALHPLAIAGYAGLITNALSLLPLGHTDGGRIATALFGRRGAFLVKTFSALSICVAGLFGLDETNVLFFYVLFVLLWQRELETPAQNEVDDLDTKRGLVGIASAVLVALTLLPLP